LLWLSAHITRVVPTHPGTIAIRPRKWLA
jgi:hypothetical protein